MNLGKIGVWSGELRFKRDRAAAHEAAAELEQLGWGALWVPGGPGGTGQPLFDVVGDLLAATATIPVATGILSIWNHDAATVAAGQERLRAAHPGRFVLGLGVSHAAFLTEEQQALSRKPRTALSQYLDGIDAAASEDLSRERVLAALRPRMLELSRDRALGAHPYFVTPEHTAFARGVLGDGPLLAPEQAVVLETDPTRAREIARAHMSVYLDLPNYTGNLLEHGIDEADLADGGSDRLVDAVVAWGDEDAVVARIGEHYAAGADHVAVQVLSGRRGDLPLPEWRRLAEALT